MRIKVRLFAGLRESVGTDELLMEVPENATVADAAGRVPAAQTASGSLAYAVNRAYARPQTILHDGDELALIPPVSGG